MAARRVVPLVVLLTALALGAPPAWGDALSFHPLPPCRIVDTRQWNAGTPSQAPNPLVGGEVRAFNAMAADLRPQGGSATGCGVPPLGAADERHRAESIAVNLVAVNAAGFGDLRIFPGDAAVAPLASVINYVPGQTIATGTIVPLRTDGTGNDFKIQADVSGTHVVVDVVGYYSRATSTTFTAHWRSLASSAGAALMQFGAISGLDVASGTAAEHQMRVPPQCKVLRFRVAESTASSAGLRSYGLYAATATPTELLFCGTGFTGACFNGNQAQVPPGGEKLYLETDNFGAVPATDALVTFEMVCN